MKLIRSLLLIPMLLVLGLSPLMADVATEGEVDVQVELLNGAKFPGFTFFIKYQSYTYNMGYQPSELSEVVLEAGKAFQTGGRGDQSKLYARDSKGKVYESKDMIGGVASDFDRNVSYYLDQIEVTKIKKGVISYKVVARKKMGVNGEVLEIKKSDVVNDDANKGRWMLFTIPVVCMIGLIAFFVLRNRKRHA